MMKAGANENPSVVSGGINSFRRLILIFQRVRRLGLFSGMDWFWFNKDWIPECKYSREAALVQAFKRRKILNRHYQGDTAKW